jgi:hypothetical protein
MIIECNVFILSLERPLSMLHCERKTKRKGREVAIVIVLAYGMGVGPVSRATKKCDLLYSKNVPPGAPVQCACLFKGPLAWCAMCPDMLNIS